MGGLKPWRKICAAKMSGLRHFKDTGYMHLTGCTAHTAQPLPKSKYCEQHEDQETPVIDHDHLREETKMKLWDKRKKMSYSKQAGQDTLYVIESINDGREICGKKEYKVKWIGYDENLDTWETEEYIPKFIKKYYSDHTKLKTKLPNPKIQHTKILANGTKMHFLRWEGVTEAGDGQWVGEDWFQIASEDGDILTTVEEGECGKRKSRDRQAKTMHSVGLFIGALPCGTIALWDELYGSEGIRQVHGITAEYLSI